MSVKTIEVLVSQPVPNVPTSMEAAIISVWEQAQSDLADDDFTVEDPVNQKQMTYKLRVDFSEIITLLKMAREYEGGFTKYRQYLRLDNAKQKPPIIRIHLEAPENPENILSYYHAAAVFLQQWFLAMNISVPGSCQILEAKYIHDETNSFDPPSLQAAPFIDAYLNSLDQQWPEVKHLNFGVVSRWLSKLQTSRTETALYPINKILFGLLELGQKSLGLTNKHSVLVAKLLDMITESGFDNPRLVRSRIGLILGSETNSISELYRLRDEHVKGARPFKRHALRVYDYEEEVLRNLRVHKSPVEEGLAILLALVQKLCSEDASSFLFEESFTVKSVKDMLS